MERYVCDVCGYEFEIELEKTNNGDMNCPICKGHCLTAEEMQSREDMAKLIDEDKGDDDMTPQEDMQEAIDEFITMAMEKNLREVGNDRTYRFIEDIGKGCDISNKEEVIKYATQRARHRKYFLLAGGQIPVNWTITREIIK